jgi:hypothetical protein
MEGLSLLRQRFYDIFFQGLLVLKNYPSNKYHIKLSYLDLNIEDVPRGTLKLLESKDKS